MDGPYTPGWYEHPQQGRIKIEQHDNGWVYICYTASGTKPLSRPRPLDPWIWALAQPTTTPPAED